MKICDNVYQIKIDFKIANRIKRYVYVYLITGKYCYLIDSGILGSEREISKYMKSIGRSIDEIKAIFLTHCHPDHIGGVADIKKLTNCIIYAYDKEKDLIENIDNQFANRPIPDFYKLVNKSVKIDKIINENDVINLEENINIKVISTSGHSIGSTSFIYEDKNIIFTGDAIPDINDTPIFENYNESIKSLYKILDIYNINFCCPAWDKIYKNNEIKDNLTKSISYLEKFRNCVLDTYKKYENLDENDKIKIICKNMDWDFNKINPLLKKSIKACLE
ncbi:MAG: MBL fold metallo-hydrolase [Lachnospirales bacterium]